MFQWTWAYHVQTFSSISTFLELWQTFEVYYSYWSKIVESRPRFAKSKNSLCLQGPTWTTLQNKLRFGIFALFFSKSANCEYLMAFIEVSRYLTKTVCIFNSNNHFRGQLKWRLYRRKNSLLSLYNLKVKGSIKD